MRGGPAIARFRVFFMACAEFFSMDKGQTWGVGHYLWVSVGLPVHLEADELTAVATCLSGLRRSRK